MNYAYTTFIIKNDSYVPGALVFAYTLKKYKTKNDLICFITDDISQEAVDSLKLLYDFVINTDQLIVENKRKQSRQDVKYLFNRFKSLLLYDDKYTGKSYEKIIIADCDLLPLSNWDDLFELNTPSGIINESKDNCMDYDEEGKFVIPNNYYKDGNWKWHKIYNKICPHGSLIPKNITDRVDKDNSNMGVISAIYLLSPSLEFYQSIIDDINDEEIKNKINNYNWPEMQYMTSKLSGTWHNIDLRYASIGGYPTLEYLKGIHFAGLKPWSFKNKSLKVFGRFDDFKLWFKVYVNMIESNKKLKQNKKLVKLYNNVKDLLNNNKYIYNKDYENTNILLKK